MDYKKLDIRRYKLMIRLEKKNDLEKKKLIEYASAHKNIIEVIKIIGSYDLIITSEEESVIKDLRKNFIIKDYKEIEIENVIKTGTVPDDRLIQ